MLGFDHCLFTIPTLLQPKCGLLINVEAGANVGFCYLLLDVCSPPFTSLLSAQTLPSKEKRGLVTIERFLDSAVLVFGKPIRSLNVMWSM